MPCEMSSDDDDIISDSESDDDFELLKLLGVKHRTSTDNGKTSSYSSSHHQHIASSNNNDQGDDDADDYVDDSQRSPKARIKRQHVVNHEEDEFAIPAVFLTDGDRNSRIFNADKTITLEIAAGESTQRKRMDEVTERKKLIIAELNDNGSENSSVQFTESQNARYIDLLLKAHYRQDMKQYRRYYFYGQETSAICKGTLEKNALQNMGNKKNLHLWSGWKSKPLTSQSTLLIYLREAITSIHSIDKLLKIAQVLVNSWEKSPLDNLFPQLSEEDFTCMVKCIGGSTCKRVPQDKNITMKFKLRQFNKGNEFTLMRLTIIYCVFARTLNISQELRESMAQCFILSINDSNLHLCLPELLKFTRIGMNLLTRMFEDETWEWVWSIVNRLKCVLYDGVEVAEYKHQTKYNIIRLINLLGYGFSSTTPEYVFSLNESYLGGPIDSNTVRRVILAANKISTDDDSATLHQIMALNWVIDSALPSEKEIRAMVELSANVRDHVYHRLQRISLGEANGNSQNMADMLVRCHTELSVLNSRLVRKASLYPPDTFI